MDEARRFAEWTETLPADVWTVFALIESEKIAQQGRRLLVGSLSYILTTLDLIPDHEKAGAVDDAMVIRLACALATEHAAEASVGDSAKLSRLANDEDVIKAALGDSIFAKLRRYVVGLADKTVRGRTSEQILTDARSRAEMKRELEQSLKKLKSAQVTNDQEGEALMLSVKSYLQMKLK